MTAIRIRLESRRVKNWRNGMRWRLEFSVWTLYFCDLMEPEAEEMVADECWYIANSKKELKKHKKEYHHANI